jgi:hypothetical protein
VEASALFFKTIINIMPTNSECFIQSPHREFVDAIKMGEYEIANLYIQISLSEKNRQVLTQIANHDIQDYIQYFKIISAEGLLFEGFDGFEFGLVSRQLSHLRPVLQKFIDLEYCAFASDW